MMQICSLATWYLQYVYSRMQPYFEIIFAHMRLPRTSCLIRALIRKNWILRSSRPIRDSRAARAVIKISRRMGGTFRFPASSRCTSLFPNSPLRKNRHIAWIEGSERRSWWSIGPHQLGGAYFRVLIAINRRSSLVRPRTRKRCGEPGLFIFWRKLSGGGTQSGY